jgi:hypothetical protein
MSVKKQDPGGCNCGAATCSIPNLSGGGSTALPAANLTISWVPLGGAAQTLVAVYNSGSNTWDTGWNQMVSSIACKWYRFLIVCSGTTAVISYAMSTTNSGTMKTPPASSNCSTAFFNINNWLATGSGPFTSRIQYTYTGPLTNGTINQ